MTLPLPESYRKAYQDFTGGLCTRQNALVVPGNKLTQLDNAVINDSDILEKVSGRVLDGSPFPNSADSFIRMLINYRVGTSVNSLVVAAQDSGNTNATYKVDIKQSLGDGSYSYIGHTDGTALFTLNSPTVTGSTTLWTKHLKAGDKIKPNLYTNWYEIQSVNSDTSLTLTANYTDTTTASVAYMARIVLNYTALPTGLVFNDKLIIANGVDSVLSFDNTSLTKLQSANWQPVLLLEKHKNRVFGARWPGNTSGILWSYANDETTVDAAGKATIFAKDNGNIVAIKSFANSLLVFKDTGYIYQVIGEFDQDQVGQPSTIIQVDIPDNIGMIAGRSVVIQEDTSDTQGYQRVGSHIYFLAETGIYAINTGMQAVKVSWDIAPTLLGISFKSTSIASKNFPFTAKSQWDAGTNSGLSTDRVTNGLNAYFDTLTLSNVKKTNNGAAVAIDTSNNVYTVYIDATGASIRFNKLLTVDNTNTDVEVLNMSTSPVIHDTSNTLIPSSWFGAGPDCVSIAVAANGNVGIVSKYNYKRPSPASGQVGLAGYIFSELVSGSWTHTLFFWTPRYPDDSLNNTYNVTALGLKVRYTAASNPQILAGQGQNTFNGNASNGAGMVFASRTAGVWASYVPIQAGGTSYDDVTFTVDGANVYVIGAVQIAEGGGIVYYKSTDSGITFTLITSIVGIGAVGAGKIGISINQAKDPIIVYNMKSAGNDTLVRYNAVSTTTTVVDAVACKLNGYSNAEGNTELYYYNEGNYETYKFDVTYQVGTAQFTNGTKVVIGTGTKWTSWVKSGDKIRIASDVENDYGTVDTVNSDTSITLLANYVGTSTTAAYVAKRTITVTDTSGVRKTEDTYRIGSEALVQNASTSLVASIAYGYSVNSLLIRRVTLFGKWTSPVESDSTLTQWFTYDVGSPIANSNTITYEVALSTSSSFTAANTNLITPGSVISTNTTFVDAKAIVTFTLGNFAQASIQSLVMRYAGAGADAKIPTAFVFNSEMYLSVAELGQTGNNAIIFYDRKQAYGKHTFAVTAMARYNQQLYAGSATNGNIYKLRQGYNDNGSAYTFTAKTKEDLLGSLELQKAISKVYVIYKTQLVGSFTFSYTLDAFKSSANPIWVDQVVDQTVDGIVEIPVQQTATSIQFKVTQGDVDVKMGIIGFIVLYGYLNLR